MNTYTYIYIYTIYTYVPSIFLLLWCEWLEGVDYIKFHVKTQKKYGKTSPLPVRPASVAGGKVLVPASPFRRRIHRSTWFIRDG